MKSKLFLLIECFALQKRFAAYIFVLFSFNAVNVSAEVLVPALGSRADKPSVVSSSSKYLLNIAKANGHGYSINSLSGLDTRGKSLVLTNSYVMNPKLAGAPAQTIVLALDKNKVASIKEIRV
ncbi:hypothetical protein, partial [Vibrio tubiashii]|uniref:hypothetical protein n=1 Tax=Vibrio tubiashii TaxID=29498 RepID=UPI00349E9876